MLQTHMTNFANLSHDELRAKAVQLAQQERLATAALIRSASVATVLNGPGERHRSAGGAFCPSHRLVSLPNRCSTGAWITRVPPPHRERIRAGPISAPPLDRLGGPQPHRRAKQEDRAEQPATATRRRAGR